MFRLDIATSVAFTYKIRIANISIIKILSQGREIVKKAYQVNHKSLKIGGIISMVFNTANKMDMEEQRDAID